MKEKKGRLPFRQLTWTDRLRLEKLLKEGHKPQEIANTLHVHNSTIYREIKRGQTKQLDTHLREIYVYTADMADRKYRENLKAKGPQLKIGKDHELANYLEEKMTDSATFRFSPCQGLAEAKKEGKMERTSISKPTLYSYIHKGVFLNLTMKDLPQGGKVKTKYQRLTRAKRAPKGDSIEQRPKEVNTKEEFGHWEMDTVVSAKNTGTKRLLVLSERKTRHELIILMKNGEAESVVKAINRIERKLGRENFKKVFRTITVDNGTEFSDCDGIQKGNRKSERTHLYYCHPFSSYERGLNEGNNKLIRRFYPKGTSFKTLTEKDVKKIEDWINKYPRKVLNYDSSAERFLAELEELGIEWTA